MRRRAWIGWALGLGLVAAAPVAAVDAKSVLAAIGFPANAEQQVLSGQYVQASLTPTSDRDLSIGIAFLVKTPPATVVAKLRAERVLQKVDPATIAYGALEGDGSEAQLAGLKLTKSQLAAYASAKPGDALNLSTDEIAAFAAAGKDPAALEAAVRAQLLARYRAYRAKGLAGIAPYARKSGQRDVAAELAAIVPQARSTKVLPASFFELLSAYPQQVPPDLVQVFFWSQFTAHGQDTLALVHGIEGTFDGTPVAVQRQYYVSTGYNAQQAIVGFLPEPSGTLVVYTAHISTDQLGGLGSSAKRGIGRALMASQLEKLFDAGKVEVAR